MLKLWIAAVGFSGILPLVSAAQEAVPRIVTPSSASVTAEGSQRLFSGQDFNFTLQFDKAPQDHRGGEINYQFDNVRYSKPFNPMDLMGRISKSGKTELIDGRADYKNLKLHITDLMLPGTWKLVKVTLGRRVQTPVSIPDNITFEIPEMPPVAVSIDAPSSVRAGQQFKVKFTLDKYPQELTEGCVLWLSVNLPQASRPITPANGVPMNAIELKPDQHSYEMSGSFDTEFPGGTWQGEMRILANRPSSDSAYQPSPKLEDFCRAPRLERDVRLEGAVRFTLLVEPDLDLVTATSVAVIVNSSQIQLLLAEAERLRAKYQDLKKRLNSENMAASQDILRDSIKTALDDLDKTEAEYKKRGKDPSPPQAVDIFFDDIRLNYKNARKDLANTPAQVLQAGPRLQRVGLVEGGGSLRLNPPSEAVLASILHEANAYYAAASSGYVTFNLQVYSVPEGATISYRLMGDKYEVSPRVTDSKIENLPIGKYCIRLQKEGYADWEGPYDAPRETERSIKGVLEQRRNPSGIEECRTPE